MPPHVPRKRSSAAPAPSEPPTKRVANGPWKAKKESVFEAVEARKPPARKEEKEQFLHQLDQAESSSSLSDAESSNDDDQDAQDLRLNQKPSDKKHKSHLERDNKDHQSESSSSDNDGEEEEDGWDDFVKEHTQKGLEKTDEKSEAVAENFELTLDQVAQIRRSDIKTPNDKKGPSKIERQIRNSTHQLHVLCLMYHNYMRNHWLNNKELQSILVNQLPPGCKDEAERWQHACGNALGTVEDDKAPGNDTNEKTTKGKGKDKPKPKRSKSHKNIRDWGPKANETEEGNPDLSHGDPTLRLLKSLSSFWRKRFNVVAPGLRKKGYKDMERMQDELDAFKEHPENQDKFGERIRSLDEMKHAARKAEGSRDLGAQLFTCLLRGLNVKARMVASLQPAGYGWSKGEEAVDDKKQRHHGESLGKQQKPNVESAAKSSSSKNAKPSKQERTPSKTQPKRQSKAQPDGQKHEPIDLSDSDSPLSDPPDHSSEDESVVDITHSRPIQTRKRYDGDLKYPHYWTEVLSPITNAWIPTDPTVLSVVSNKLHSHSVFEPRGAGVEHTKQVLAYVIAFHPDTTAKDVTTRYLKRQMWPGKTKGMRYPVEKRPIYNSRGKILHHEPHDWFADVLRCYQHRTPTRTPADDLEDTHDLRPVHPQPTSTGPKQQESLQFYKTHPTLLLARHLHRDEALLPHAAPVKTFRTGKGASAQDEPVYNRADVVACKSAESWHKEGREITLGQHPLKRVPMRAVTAVRKAEVEQLERETGEKAMQGLYARAQTQWIVPPPIVDGVIPRNAFGNIDVYVPTMVPAGAVHVPLRGAAKVCRKLGVEHAEACTGFEFGNRMAVPVITGVVVAAENEAVVVEASREEERVRVEKERAKRAKQALGLWGRFVRGLRVLERVRREYGVVDERRLREEMDAGGKTARGPKKGQAKKTAPSPDVRTDVNAPAPDAAGGFLPPGTDAEILDPPAAGGGFVIEHDDPPAASTPATTSPRPMKSLRERAADVERLGERGTGQDDEDALRQDNDNEEALQQAGEEALRQAGEDALQQAGEDVLREDGKRAAQQTSQSITWHSASGGVQVAVPHAAAGAQSTRGTKRKRRSAFVDEDGAETDTEASVSSEEGDGESDGYVPVGKVGSVRKRRRGVDMAGERRVTRRSARHGG